MAISATCPNGHSFKLKDEHAGRRTKCPTCGAPMTVPGGAAPALPPVKRKSTSRTKTAPAQESSRTPLIIGGIVGAVALLGVLAVLFMGGDNEPVADVPDEPAEPILNGNAAPAGAESLPPVQMQQTAGTQSAGTPNLAAGGQGQPGAAGSPAATALEKTPAPNVQLEPLDPSRLWGLPPGQEMFLIVRPQEILDSPVAANLFSLSQEGEEGTLGQLTEVLGMDPRNIDAMVTVTPSLRETIDSAQAKTSGLAGSAMNVTPGLSLNPADEAEVQPIVILPKSTADWDAVLANFQNRETKQHSGSDYHLVTTEQGQTYAAYYQDGTALVLGTEPQIQAAIERAAQPGVSDIPASVIEATRSSHIVIAAVPQSGSFPVPDDAAASGDEGGLIPALADHASAAILGLMVTDRIQLQLLVDSQDAAGTSAIGTAAAEAVSEMKAAWETAKANVPPFLLPYVDYVVESIDTQQSGTQAMLTAELPPQLFEPQTLQTLPAMVMGFAMTGGLGNLAGGGEQSFSITPGEMTEDSGFSFETSDGELEMQQTVQEGGLTKSVALSAEPPGQMFPADEPAIYVTIKLDGGQIPSATRWGNLTLATLTDDTGKSLQPIAPRFGQPDPTKELAKVDRGFVFPGEEPPPHAMIAFAITKPADNATSLSMAGEMDVMVGGTRNEILVEDLPAKLGQPINDPGLEAAGVSITLAEGEGFMPGSKSVEAAVEGETGAITQMTLVNAAGEDLTRGTGVSGAGKNVTHILTYAGQLPADARLKIETLTGQEPLDVPFSFENLKLPSAE